MKSPSDMAEEICTRIIAYINKGVPYDLTAIIEADRAALVEEIAAWVECYLADTDEWATCDAIRDRFGQPTHPEEYKFALTSPSECGSCRGPDCEGCEQSTHWYWWRSGKR